MCRLPSPPQGWSPPGRSPLPQRHQADPIPAKAPALPTGAPVNDGSNASHPTPSPPGSRPRPEASERCTDGAPAPSSSPQSAGSAPQAAPRRASPPAPSLHRAQAIASPRRYRRRHAKGSSPHGSLGSAGLGPPEPSFVAPGGRRQRMGATEAPEPSSGRSARGPPPAQLPGRRRRSGARRRPFPAHPRCGQCRCRRQARASPAPDAPRRCSRDPVAPQGSGSRSSSTAPGNREEP
ncbi:basic proline-rich protein-like [Pogoniulus pusillus]|uniref:basic proline-rich protein-like n=1 Tax=Pogoniulus pusillus TaxID=488313 RepID=UPI0030B97D06